MIKLESLQPSASIRGILPDTSVTRLRPSDYGGASPRLPRAHRRQESRYVSNDTGLPRRRPEGAKAGLRGHVPRQPLRFLLADDPGAGKTIMAGLLIKELIARGDFKRCLVVCPGSLAEQWQDTPILARRSSKSKGGRRFHRPFEILTNDKLEAAHTGNWFLENDLAIARLDKLPGAPKPKGEGGSRNEDVQAKLGIEDCRYDLVVCDEAHKMPAPPKPRRGEGGPATFFGGEVKYTKRYHLGQLLSGLTRHFLLMTATPHNGEEEDFQLFLTLLDGDCFEGRFRDGVHQVDVSGLMRRMVKESLLKFDGRRLFPERIACTRLRASRYGEASPITC